MRQVVNSDKLMFKREEEANGRLNTAVARSHDASHVTWSASRNTLFYKLIKILNKNNILKSFYLRALWKSLFSGPKIMSTGSHNLITCR